MVLLLQLSFQSLKVSKVTPLFINNCNLYNRSPDDINMLNKRSQNLYQSADM